MSLWLLTCSLPHYSLLATCFFCSAQQSGFEALQILPSPNQACQPASAFLQLLRNSLEPYLDLVWKALFPPIPCRSSLQIQFRLSFRTRLTPVVATSLH